MNSRGTRHRIILATAVLAGSAAAARATPVLVGTSDAVDGTGDGYGGFAWTRMTGDLNAAAGGAVASGAVTVTTDLSDPATLLAYDGIWVDLRNPDGADDVDALSPGETSALTAYIATGRRVVLVGGNSAFGMWDASVLGLVGGTVGGGISKATVSRSAIVPLTASPAVATVYAPSGSVAASNAAAATLFTQRVATVWGPAQNVVVLLDPNLPDDDDIGKAANATFANNLATWVAGGLPDAGVLWKPAVASGAWQDPTAWQSAAVPGMPAVADAAVFNGSAGTTVTTVAGPVTARSLVVGTDRLTLDFNTSSAGLTVGSAITVGSGATLSLTHSAGGGVATLSAASVSAAGPVGVGPGVRLSLTAAGTASRFASLTLGGGPGGGQVGLDGGDLIVTGGDLAAVTAEVTAGYDGGRWDGPGITSAAAAADPRQVLAVGAILNATATGSALYASFDGQPVAATDVLVRRTEYGDTNLDGLVDAADYTRIDAGFIGGLTGWANGDFNGDGVVDGSDYTLMDNAFNAAADPTAAAAVDVAAVDVAAVPEPATVGVIALAALGRRRRH